MSFNAVKNGAPAGAEENPIPEEPDWLDCCIPWDGIEEKLPTGYQAPPGMDILKLIRSWRILDAETDEGFREVFSRNLKPGDCIIGATANKNSIKAIMATYGPDAFRFTDAHGQEHSAKEWAELAGTNPFELLAIARMSKRLN